MKLVRVLGLLALIEQIFVVEGLTPWLMAADSITAARPHIVVFLSDDHGQLDSTPYAATDVRTPNMQRLAEAGMVFTHAFTASPSCAPSRAAMLTGLMPARNGAEANHTFKRDDVPSLPDVLRKAGYQTAAFGKVAHHVRDAARHGFDVVDSRHQAAVVEKFLRERDASRPLCLFVGTHEPHVPWPDLEGYDPSAIRLPPNHVDTPNTREQRARYYTDVTKADTQLGEILDLVDRYLDRRHTLILYTSDHGAQWPFGKWNLYDAGIRVPLIVAWPGVIRPGTRSAAMVQLIDILPTLIEVAGGQVPPGIDGRSFLAVLREERPTHREEIFTTHNNDGRMNVYPIRSIRTARFKYILNLHPEWAHTTHIDQGRGSGDGWRYFLEWVDYARREPAAAAIVRRYNERPDEELYDLEQDPYELHNLAGDPAYAAILRELRDRLSQWRKEQGDTGEVTVEPRLLANPEDYRPRAP